MEGMRWDEGNEMEWMNGGYGGKSERDYLAG